MGVSIVNALSQSLKVVVVRGGDNHQYEMLFSNGSIKKQLSKTKKNIKKKSGTIIKFKINEKYFDTHKLDIKDLHNLRSKI